MSAARAESAKGVRVVGQATAVPARRKTAEHKVADEADQADRARFAPERI